MKDTFLTAVRKRTELLSFLVCLLVANLTNLYSIITFKAPAKEMLTSAFYVLAFAFVLYVLWSLFRIFIYLIMRLFK